MENQKNNIDLFKQLLKSSEIFNDAATTLINTALDKNALPDETFEELLLLLQMEQNVNHLIDQRGQELLDQLKEKHDIS